MEANLVKLGDAFDRNTEVFSDTLKLLEGQSAILQRVVNDSLNGTVRCKFDIVAPGEKPIRMPEKIGGPSEIDFHSYLMEYWTCLVFVDFVTWLSSLQKKEETGPGIIIPSSEETETIIFGG